MTLEELIDQLEDYRDQFGGEIEVRLMTQSNWPFENSIYGLGSSDEIQDAGDNEEISDKEIIYIVEGNQLGYGTKTAWDAAN